MLNTLNKKAKHCIKLYVTAGNTLSNPTMASALGPKGVSIKKFCDEFNKVSKDTHTLGEKVVAIVKIYQDKSFTFKIKSLPVSLLFKNILKQDKGSSNPGKDTIASLKLSQIHTIAQKKINDTNAYDIDAVIRMLIGTAQSMGIEVVDDKE